ncbi:ectoine/hydroxyectoine ABC transporter permease subunit EhuD [Aureimonas fodinaquatilis]|uniref:Ectoine/hydroxyectoine ABC transporter permease subunit EhuD n=1 Tax=Aureimonas fodinaquatilis TaxID=2565783 RepID=A0A5B0DNX6_9HYPH|nr:ectoine/hydroxyectoine ABC transporter permease subunit EhuD [Aureimonas fodinaquatilis]KAA0968103.1 ectoine/hydroxyectoine ABC transporter permease subunit EhuD [Aureimonas fodinaquatilis]
MEWDWNFTWQIMPTLLEGVKITIIATLLGFALAAVLGLVIAVARRSRHRWLARSVSGFTEFVRGTPLLVQLYFLFYILPEAGVTLAPLVAGVIGLGVHYATYTAEVYRAGIDNVSRGQWEAAKACNLSEGQTWRHIILPQAIAPMVPALANYLIAMFKETPLLSAITVLELMNQARSIANFNYRYIEPITLVGAFFLVISLIAVVGVRFLERRYGKVA